MTFTRGFKFAALGLLAAAGVSGSASAAVYQPTSVVASSAFPGYGASNAVDGNNLTDWAANNMQTGATLQMTFASPLNFIDANVTDRTTSGGAGQGTFGDGTTDFTTKYTIQGFTDATFTTANSAAYTETLTTPANPQTPADFQSTLGLAGLVSQYVQYTVLASNGPNPGLAEINFDANPVVASVPEPASLLIISVGLAGVAFARNRRNQKI